MKSSMRRMLVVLAIVMSLAAVQVGAALATTAVSGVVYSVNATENSIVVDTGSSMVTVYCIPLAYLDKKNIAILGQQVVIEALERIYSDGTTKLIAVSLAVNGTVIPLPGKNPKRG
jgi:hypothetical protein